MMNVLHLNANIDSKNLSFPHYQFHRLMADNGHCSRLVVSFGNVFEEDITILEKGDRKSKWELGLILRKLLFSYLIRNKHVHYFPEWNTRFTSVKAIKRSLSFKPDIIITYWTKYSFNQKLIYKLSKMYDAPVLSVLYDMGHLTGGCHYTFGCENYKDKCGKCPVLRSKCDHDLSRRTWNFKKKYIDKTNISLLAGTEESLNDAKSSGLFKDHKVYKMLGSVDETIFKPGDKISIKKNLGLDKYKKIIFFGVANIREPRKGFKYLVEALEILKAKYNDENYTKEDICLLIAGRKMDDIELPFDSKYLGYLETQEKLAEAFQCADVFASASIEEAGPMMVNIAMVSGVPVVAFDIGVAKDLVIPNQTGHIAELKNTEDFALGLEHILALNEVEWTEVSSNCRKKGLELCSSETQYERLLTILEDVIGHHSN